jgi:hypothetical protein
MLLEDSNDSAFAIAHPFGDEVARENGFARSSRPAHQY